MDLKKEDEENVAYQEEAPAVPPKIPDSHLDKVTFIAVYLFQYANLISIQNYVDLNAYNTFQS